MMRMMMALSLGFAGVVLAVQIARAEPQCAARETVVRVLAATAMARTAAALAWPTQVRELFTNEGTGTWTIMLTMPDGVTGMVASGQGFRALDDPLPARGQNI